MGAGKSTIGRHLAELFEFPFVDLDHEIEERTGASISLIFDLEGESGFRHREAAMLDELSQRDGIVLATGGGAILEATSRVHLRERGFVIWLDASIDVQLARLARDRHRPLLKADDRRARLDELAATRNPLYTEVSDLHIPCSGVGNTLHAALILADNLRTQWQRGAATTGA